LKVTVSPALALLKVHHIEVTRLKLHLVCVCVCVCVWTFLNMFIKIWTHIL